MKAPANTTWPILVPKDRGPVKIYRINPRGVEHYSVDYYFAGRRQRRAYADFAEATKAAKEAADKLKSGNGDALTLTANDKLIYSRALSSIAGLHTPLDIVAQEWAKVRRSHPNVTLEQMKECWDKHNAGIISRTVAEVAEEMIDSKRQAGRSAAYLKDMVLRMRHFSKAFSCPISAVTGRDMETWLRELKLSPRSRNNYRRAIFTLAEFAKDCHYLSREWNELDAVPIANDKGGTIEIFSIDEITKLLKRAEPHQLPYLAIGAFAGVRSAEISRLDWADVGTDYITVQAAKAKTASRRLVPVQANLAAWLAPYRKPSGPVATYSNMAEEMLWLAGKSKVTWKHNGLRHSYISYRLAQAQDAAKVALEAGNSPQMIFKHYRELVKPEQASAWFSITP